MDALTCPHCGTALPAVSDAYCLVCRKPLGEPPEVAALETEQPQAGLVGGTEPNRAETPDLSRQLQVPGWLLLVWGTLGVVIGFVVGPPYVLAFFALVLAMGWQSVHCASRLGKTIGADPKAFEVLGKSYVRQLWLVITWLALQVAFAIYMATSTK